MDFKIILSIIFIISNNVVFANNNKENDKSELNFKNYAFSTCIADGFKSKEIKYDAASAARGYLEFGSLPLEAHTKATLMGRDILKKTYKSKSGTKLVIMKCLDFYNSKELNTLYLKYK